MGKLTAQDMVTRVRSNIGNIQSEQYPDDSILAALNDHQIRITASNAWTDYCATENITTSNGTSEYTMSSTNVLAIENVINATSGYRYDLKRMDESDYDLWGRGAGATGPPTHYYVSGPTASSATTDRRKLEFWPTPNGTYTLTVRYAVRPTDLVTSPTANYSVLPSQFDEVLIAYATADAWLANNEFDKAGGWGKVAEAKERAALKFTVRLSEVPASSGTSWRAGVRGF